MMSPGDQDPFLQVQDDVQSQLLTTRGLFSSYLRIRSLHQQNSSSSSNESPELNSARLDLLAALDDLREDVNDLADAVRAAEKEPAAFGLDGVEVSRRRREVLEIQGEVEDMAEEVSNADRHSAAEQQKHPFPRHRRVGSKGSNSKLPDPGAFAVMEADGSGGHAQGSGAGARRRQGQEDGEDYAAEFEHQTQQMLMREQDEQLDSVYVTVGTLRNMADDMGRELNEQTEMLDHTGTLADRVGDRLQTGMDKMKYVIRKNEDGLSSCCIAVLITVLIILLVLLLIL